MSVSSQLKATSSKESVTLSSYENTSIGSSSLISSKNDRLKFLRKSPIKRAKRSFINLYSYLFSCLPIQTLVCQIMFGLRLIQMFVLSCFYPNEKLYPRKSYSHNVGIFLSIFTRFFPIDTKIEYQMVLGWIYVCFFVFHILFLGFSAYYFEKKSTLPSFIPVLLSYVFLIIEYLPHPWIMSMAGNVCSQDKKDINTKQIVLVVLSLVTAFIFFILHQFLNIASIFFTPSAIKIANPWPQSSMTLTVSVICFLGEYSGHIDNKVVAVVMMFLTILGYCLIFYFMTFIAHFLDGFQETVLCSVTFGCIINTICSIIFFILDKEMPEYMIIIVITCMAASAFVIMYLRNRRFIKSIHLLDSLEESKDNFQMFKKSSQIIPHILVGFQVNHRYCLSYSIFVDSLSIFEEDFSLLVIFAKFLAIYPEEYSQLNWIYAMVAKNKLKKFKKKYIKAQLMTILMRRESTLSNELRKKLQSISNLIVTAKMRIKNTWEAALSGATSELEPLFASYSTIIKQIDLKFTYLQNYHSNNQYALTALSNYERDVQANYELAAIHREKARRIKLGHNDGIDQVYLYGRVYFPNLPPRPIYHNMKGNSQRPLITTGARITGTSATNSETDSIENTEIIEDDGNLYWQDMQTRLRNNIMNMSISSLRMSMTLSMIMIVIFFVIPFVLVLAMIKPMEDKIFNPVKYLTNLDLIHKMILHLYGLICHWIMEGEPLNLPNLCEEEKWSQDGGVPESLGGDCHTNKILMHFAQIALDAITEISEMKKDNSNNKILKEVKDVLFKNNTQFYVFKNFNQIEKFENKSLQQGVIDSLFAVIRITNSENQGQFMTSRDLVNLLFNSFGFEEAIKALTEKLLNYIIDHTTRIKNIFTILEITLSVSFPVIFIIVSIILLKWSQTQKMKVFRCFNSLPKTTLSRLIEASNMEPTENNENDTEKTAKEIEHKRQEERTITVFRSGDIGSQASHIVAIIIIGLLIIISDLIFINFGCQYYIQNSNDFIYSSPLLKHCSYTYCDAVSSLLLLNCKAWMDNGLEQASLTNTFIVGALMLKLQYTVDSYKVVYYGDTKNKTNTISKYVKNFNKYQTSKCEFTDVVSDLEHSMYRCLSDDSLYHYYVNLVRRLLYTYTLSGRKFELKTKMMYDMWHILFGHLYPYYMEPLTTELTNSVRHVFTNNKSKLIIISTLLLVFGLIISLIYVYKLSQQELKLKQVLLLLLHVPPQEILESTYIMSIISGDFSSRDSSGIHLDDTVYKSITENYPNGFLLINNVGNILFMNSKACEYLTKQKVDDNEENKETKNKNKQKNKNININDVKIPNEIVLNQNLFNLNGRLIDAKYSKIDANKTLVTLIDMSIIQKLERELDDETKRKTSLVSQLMPTIMTPKFMSSQEQGVSFSVQSVTVAMISIGIENQDDNSIQLFNEVHNSLNSLIVEKRFQTIESVEIIGDVFMIVGGLFDEVNQTERHAQEVIRYTLDAIQTIKTIKEKCQCSNFPTICGVATGGPVFGGVIELDLPIFEVCGDVIDLADEMMVLGLPDKIHTTRAVYEFIYGRDFKIKERGEMQIPNFGTVVTYIVSSSNEE